MEVDASEDEIEGTVGRRNTVSVSELLVTTKMHAIANMNKKLEAQLSPNSRS